MLELTELQQAAAYTEAQDVLVIAGAGSGKTRVLAARVSYLLAECGVPPSDLMVLTFTRRAAAEMRERVQLAISATGHPDPVGAVRDIRMGTFHSIAFQMLRTYAVALGYGEPKALNVIEPEDAQMLLEQVGDDFGHRAKGKWKDCTKGELNDELERYYHTGIPHMEEPIGSIIAEYRNRLFTMGLLDFGSILLQCRIMFQHHPDIRRTVAAQIKHVLVDEIQDANAIQHYGFLDVFTPPASFFAVGDRRQSIYKFRGARPDLMTERHPDAVIVDLNECFRCGDSIVEVANDLIVHNDDPLATPMDPKAGYPGTVFPAYGRSEQIADGLQHFIDDGVPLRDIAVMSRTHRHLRRMEQILDERQIPCHRVGSRFDICTTEAFRNVHAAFRLLINGRDNLAFLRIKRCLRISNETYAMIRSNAGGGSHLIAAAIHTQGAHAAFFDRLSKADFEPMIDAASKQIISHLCIDGLTPEYMETDQFWSEHYAGHTVASALREFSMRDQQDDLPDDDVVTLLTIHAAKGLEWECCLVINMNEGDFPGTKVKTAEDLEEERRVCYVAMTRAKQALVPHFRRPEDQALPKGKEAKAKPPSRFLSEAGIL